MRNLIEYTLVSADGVFSGPVVTRFFDHRDEHYLRDGLGQLCACDAMLMGRTTYERFSGVWPGRDHPWAARLNAMPKFVFSSTLDRVDWTNSTLVRGDPAKEVAALKEQDGGDLLIYGHGRLARTLLQAGLTDVLDLSVHPIFAGEGEHLPVEDGPVVLRPVATKVFQGIVKITYRPAG